MLKNSIQATVGAVCDRALLLESTKYARSQTAPTKHSHPTTDFFSSLLERHKLIKGEWKTTPNGRRARYYRLTAAGSKRLVEVEKSWAVLTESVGKVLRFV